MRRYYRLNTAWFQSSDEEPADIDLDELDVVLVSDLQKTLLPVLQDHRKVFQSAIDVMPHPGGALQLVVDAHRKRVTKLDTLIADMEEMS